MTGRWLRGDSTLGTTGAMRDFVFAAAPTGGVRPGLVTDHPQGGAAAPEKLQQLLGIPR
jgi:hypothetical protein